MHAFRINSIELGEAGNGNGFAATTDNTILVLLGRRKSQVYSIKLFTCECVRPVIWSNSVFDDVKAKTTIKFKWRRKVNLVKDETEHSIQNF